MDTAGPFHNVSATAYQNFMGRYSEPLAELFADVAGIGHGQHALDVGCGPGALTAELVRRLGTSAVSAVEPSAPFTTAVGQRLPGVDVRQAAAEHLPFPDGVFDVTLAQLVVHFMTDPVAGLREMGRVTAAGGVVAACVWDHGGGQGPLGVFWRAVLDLDPAAHDESALAGASKGDLVRLFGLAGLSGRARSARPQETLISVTVPHATFAQWWEPFTLGVGPAGAYVASLDPVQRKALREHCRTLLPDEPFEVSASAWAVTCRV